MYVAAITFADLKDGKRLYHEGDKYPRDGLAVSEERLAELAGSDNLARRPLIIAVPDRVEKKPEEKPEPKKPVQRKRGASRAR